MDILKHNLDNIESEINLFGEKIDKLTMKDRIGFAPISIWEPDWQKVKELKKVIGDNGQTRDMVKDSKNFRTVGWSGKDKPQKISIFNPHLAQMILSAYCPKNAYIYDPFAGGGTRGFIAVAMGHKYYGREIRQAEVDRIKKKQKELNKQFIIDVLDAQVPLARNNIFDFSYTCPPYYNLEIYSDMKEDLSNAGSYADFLSMLKKVLYNVFNGLKDNSLSVWVVGNFRDKNGELIYFNGDLINIAKDVGFRLHDDIIFYGASKSAVQRSGNFLANRKSVRVHEHIIILKKI